MLVIGSTAFEKITSHKMPRPDGHIKDLDLMMTNEEYETVVLNSWSKVCPDMIIKKDTPDYVHVTNAFGYDNIEIYLGHDNNSTEQLINYCSDSSEGDLIYAPLNVLYAIKLSHRYLRNSPHFIKTHRDIMYFRSLGANLADDVLFDIFKLREKETYNYKHPVLDQSKEKFFSGDGVDYIYDHDSIHEAIKILDKPAYMNYIQDGAAVMTSKEKFFEQSDYIKLLGVYEETCVLALERSQIPNNFEISPKQSFITALIKVCTSITSGYFREYAWENFNTIIKMYRQFGEDDYIKRFNNNNELLKSHEVKENV